MTFHERRKKPRTLADFDIRIGLLGESSPARVRDISASGIRCIVDRPLKPMTQVEIVLLLPAAADAPSSHADPGREIVCRGAVVRSGPVADVRAADGKAASERRKRFDTAIFFTDMKESDRDQVEEFVSARLRSTSVRD
jgi:hypothetical protein